MPDRKVPPELLPPSPDPPDLLPPSPDRKSPPEPMDFQAQPDRKGPWGCFIRRGTYRTNMPFPTDGRSVGEML